MKQVVQTVPEQKAEVSPLVLGASIAGGMALGIGAYILYSKVSRNESKESASSEIEIAKKEIANSGKLTLSQGDYLKLANDIKEATTVAGTGAGTNTEKVYSVFEKLNTYQDYQAVSVEFGIIKYNKTWGRIVDGAINVYRWFGAYTYCNMRCVLFVEYTDNRKQLERLRALVELKGWKLDF